MWCFSLTLNHCLWMLPDPAALSASLLSISLLQAFEIQIKMWLNPSGLVHDSIKNSSSLFGMFSLFLLFWQKSCLLLPLIHQKPDSPLILFSPDWPTFSYFAFNFWITSISEGSFFCKPALISRFETPLKQLDPLNCRDNLIYSAWSCLQGLVWEEPDPGARFHPQSF